MATREWNPEGILELRRPGFMEEMGARVSRGFEWSSPTYAAREMDITGMEYGGAMGSGPIDWQAQVMGIDPISGGSPFSQAVEIAAPKMTESEWKSSEFYRPEIPFQHNMTRGRAQILSEVYDNARARDALLAKSPGGAGRAVAGFIAEMVPQALDPINYIPIFGQANVARSIGTRVLLSAADAMINTAVVDAALIPMMQAAGEQVTWRDAVTDIAFAGLIGSMFGAGTGFLSKRQAMREHRANLKAAVVQMIENEEVEFVPYAGRGSRSGGMVEDIITTQEAMRYREADLARERAKANAESWKIMQAEAEANARPDPWIEILDGKRMLNPEQSHMLYSMRQQLAQAQGPVRMPKMDEYGNMAGWTGWNDNPEWFKNRGWGKNNALSVMDKILAGQEVAPAKQREIAEAIGTALEREVEALSQFYPDPRSPEIDQWPVPEEHLAELDQAGQRMLSPEEPPPIEQQLDIEELRAISEEAQDPEVLADITEAINELNAADRRANAWTEAALCVGESI